ncbi:NAD(P)H-binding protein [Streptantibioticus parmotrematis]|uniref:NmrA family NAD(P)-binding protein n=1 Tax=Streptantibioticus parmotrematis TaxID=2873249 RepID=UPI0034024230
MIVITAPTGNIGSGVVEQVLGADEPVRVIVRDPSRLPGPVRDRVEVVRGSHGDADVVNEAFEGADAVFWLVPSDPRAPSVQAAYAGFARPGIEAFARHGVRHVVGISALGRGTAVAGRAGHVTATLAMDDLIASSGVHYRALTNPSFMENTLHSVHSIRTPGTFTSPIAADRKLPVVATRDIAAVAAGLLLDRGWSGVEEVPVLGPQDLSADDMARIISEVLATPVTYRQMPGEALKDSLTGHGMSEPMAQAMVDMMLAKDAGLDSAVTRTPRSSTPTTFRQWCQEVLKPAFDAVQDA